MDCDKYRIVLTCWDYGKKDPYSDCILDMYKSYDDAYESMQRCAIEETESLNEPTEGNENSGHFKVDFDGNHGAIIRLWEHAEDVIEGSNDYMNVTVYNIHKIVCFDDFYKYRGCYILVNPKKTSFSVEMFDTIMFRGKSLHDALSFIDDFALAFKKGK